MTTFQQAPRCIILSQRELAELSMLSENLLNKANDEFGADISNNLLLDQFILNVAKILHRQPPAKSTSTSNNEKMIREALQYIQIHFQEDISLEDISNHLFISKSSLCKNFKEQTGFTIGSYITMYRLQVACSLLEKGEKVKNVGVSVGFKTYTHFIRTFTTKLGESPKSFVKTHTDNFKEKK